jgi:hypothetical protein
MTTFALVHGGWQCAWRWERLTAFLQLTGPQELIYVDQPTGVTPPSAARTTRTC